MESMGSAKTTSGADARVKVTLDDFTQSMVSRLTMKDNPFAATALELNIDTHSKASTVLSLAQLGARILQEQALAAGYQELAEQYYDSPEAQAAFRTHRNRRLQAWPE